MEDTRIMELADGRELAWMELGDLGGAPVFGFHGTPGSRRQLVIDEEPVRAAGIRLIAVDRPGYGHSTFQPGRRLVDWPGDVEQLADHLGVECFGVVGVSGGGPHSVVCAALLADRVSVAGVVSGVGSLAEPGAEEGMTPMNVILSRWSRRFPGPIRLVFSGLATVQRRWPDQAVKAMVKQAPAADAEIIARPAVRELFLTEARRAPATAGRAAAQDFQLFSGDWGFRLADIDVPVHLWQGDADRNVPMAHARLMASAIPGAILHEMPGAGHLFVIDHLPEILGTLRPLVARTV